MLSKPKIVVQSFYASIREQKWLDCSAAALRVGAHEESDKVTHRETRFGAGFVQMAEVIIIHAEGVSAKSAISEELTQFRQSVDTEIVSDALVRLADCLGRSRRRIAVFSRNECFLQPIEGKYWLTAISFAA